jgi:hypothetical protein
LFEKGSTTRSPRKISHEKKKGQKKCQDQKFFAFCPETSKNKDLMLFVERLRQVFNVWFPDVIANVIISLLELAPKEAFYSWLIAGCRPRPGYYQRVVSRVDNDGSVIVRTFTFRLSTDELIVRTTKKFDYMPRRVECLPLRNII